MRAWRYHHDSHSRSSCLHTNWAWSLSKVWIPWMITHLWMPYLDFEEGSIDHHIGRWSGLVACSLHHQSLAIEDWLGSWDPSMLDFESSSLRSSRSFWYLRVQPFVVDFDHYSLILQSDRSPSSWCSSNSFLDYGQAVASRSGSSCQKSSEMLRTSEKIIRHLYLQRRSTHWQDLPPDCLSLTRCLLSHLGQPLCARQCQPCQTSTGSSHCPKIPSLRC